VASAVRDVLLFGDFPLTRQRATCERVIVHLLREALRRDDVPAELLVWAIYTQTALHVSGLCCAASSLTCLSHAERGVMRVVPSFRAVVSFCLDRVASGLICLCRSRPPPPYSVPILC
jgi:hypothetical protein